MSVKLGHFEILEQIGKGGMAAVFRAYDPSLNRTVAIKLLDEELARQDRQFVENFIREAQSAAAINHPNIVQIYFVGEEAGNYYIVMELLEGKSLDELIRENGLVEEATALRIGCQVAEALRAAYANEMIHGDIKPQNIFVTKEGNAKLLDFGLAKMANIEVIPESDGKVWGSAYYISPERVGQKAEDFRSDIYSLGATLFHTLVGHPPFDADTADGLAAKRLNEKAPMLRQINPKISTKTERIVARMLEKNTFLRYLDYNSLIAELRVTEVMGDGKSSTGMLEPATSPSELPQTQSNTGPIARTGLIGQITATPQPAIKNKFPAIFAATAAALLIGGGIGYHSLTRNSPPSPGMSSPEQPVDQTASNGTPPLLANNSDFSVLTLTPGDILRCEFFVFKENEKITSSYFRLCYPSDKADQFSGITGRDVQKKLKILMDGKTVAEAMITKVERGRCIQLQISSLDNALKVAKALANPPQKAAPIFSHSPGITPFAIASSDVLRVAVLIFRDHSVLEITLEASKLAEFSKALADNPGKMIRITLNDKPVQDLTLTKPLMGNSIKIDMPSVEEAFNQAGSLARP